MQFTKMHGLGNDYLYVYGEPEHPLNGPLSFPIVTSVQDPTA